MIADGIITMIIWFYQGILKILPVNLGFISYSSWINNLGYIGDLLQNFLVVLNMVININILIACFMGIIAFELALLGARTINWIINVVRGSGAKI